MPVKIEFETGNAAFADGGHEVARILRQIANECAGGVDHGRHGPIVGNARLVVDANGNIIGRWSATIDAEREGDE